MGMFDSFIIKNHHDEEIEIQTKMFSNSLQRWRVGDCIDSAPKGVHTYWVPLNKDLTKIYDNIPAAQFIAFITIANGIFVYSTIITGTDDYPESWIHSEIESLNEIWNNSHYFINFIIDKMQKQQNKIKSLESHLSNLEDAIITWNDPEKRKADDEDGIFDFNRTIPKDVKDNASFIDYLEEMTKNKVDYNYKFEAVDNLRL
jgi:hypothetical protein